MVDKTARVDGKWTERDTEICDRAENSGMAVSAGTKNPVTLQELKELAASYDKVRKNTDLDVFLKDRVSSIPFEF